jgi:hypothetical protein
MKIFFRTTSHKSGKFGPDWFSYESCFENLLKEFPNKEDITVFFDGEPSSEHFVSNYNCKIVHTNAGSEAQSFTNLIDYIIGLNLPGDEIVYIVEDDYLHRPNAMKILQEAFDCLDTDYVTLYDESAKYFPGYFEQFAYGFKTNLIFTESTHWKTTPSTTNTFATRVKTLREDIEEHKKFSAPPLTISEYHKKFHALWAKGRMLVSSLPGYSTHVENMLMSPVFDWGSLSSEFSLPKSRDLPIDPIHDTVIDAR